MDDQQAMPSSLSRSQAGGIIMLETPIGDVSRRANVSDRTVSFLSASRFTLLVFLGLRWADFSLFFLEAI
jgi:hypothetical protein